jgi:hypothetical protein
MHEAKRMNVSNHPGYLKHLRETYMNADREPLKLDLRDLELLPRTDLPSSAIDATYHVSCVV